MRLASSFDGSFYPAEPDALEEVVDLFLGRAPRPPQGQGVGVLLPHAGYVYSGRTAGMAVGALTNQTPDAAVVLAPSHRHPLRGVRILDVEGFETPLGPVDAEVDLARELGALLGEGSVGEPFPEHAIEVELPLLRRAFGGIRVVAVAFGAPDWNVSQRVASALTDLRQRWQLLVVASSDLSHYYHRDQARELDLRFRALLEAGEPVAMAQALARGEVEACGAGCVLTLMEHARQCGARFSVVDQTDSSEASGDIDNVVGYLSALAVRPAAS